MGDRAHPCEKENHTSTRLNVWRLLPMNASLRAVPRHPPVGEEGKAEWITNNFKEKKKTF